jgi:hypothetical protein
MPDTATVTFTVIGLERLRDRGRLLAFANVELVIEGVELKLQGIGVVRERDGSLTCEAPRFRHPDGRWLPGVVLPKELTTAIATEVLAAYRQGL